MKIVRQPVICNDKGEPIQLNKREKAMAAWLQRDCDRRFKNSLGVQIPITTLTTVLKRVADAKYFEVFPADYMPVNVGEGAWSASITTYRAFDVVDAFETGIINLGGQNGRLAVAETGVDALNQPVINWAKQLGWSIPELEQCSKAANWDVITSKAKARKRNWDLGIQKVAFLGTAGVIGANGASNYGLLNQPNAAVNNTLITKPLSLMTSTELNTFMAKAIEAYRYNTNRTAWPSHFVIPESDYNGLASQMSDAFPIKSKIAVLEEAFSLITKKPFRILPLAYADVAFSSGVLTQQTYAMYNGLDEDSLRMNIPVDYTSTLANSVDNFMFQNVGYGQFSGVLPIRPLELMYFRFTPQ